MLDQMEFSLLQSQSRVEQEVLEQETKDLETLLKTFTEETEKQQNQNSSQDNNVVPKKEMKRKSNYSNTKVKARNLLTNVAYGRFKQSDFLKDSFIIDLLSFLLQNFNPINLDITLELEKERKMVKFMWDVCLPHEFVTFIFLTYQKANAIVKAYLFEDSNRINQLKYKIAKKFTLVHYIYSFLYAKIYNRTNHFGIKRKNDFDFQFQLWRKEKQKFIAKDPNNYENRKIEKEEQAPINLDDVEENTSKKKQTQ